MITGEIFISTTWSASTSFIPFDVGMRDADDAKHGGVNNRGYFATTAYVHGLWEHQMFEDDFKESLRVSNKYANVSKNYGAGVEEMRGLGGGYVPVNNAFYPGTIIETSVLKIKALKDTPNRSGVQVARRLVKGNKLVFKYVAVGELVRP